MTTMLRWIQARKEPPQFTAKIKIQFRHRGETHPPGKVRTLRTRILKDLWTLASSSCSQVCRSPRHRAHTALFWAAWTFWELTKVAYKISINPYCSNNLCSKWAKIWEIIKPHKMTSLVKDLPLCKVGSDSCLTLGIKRIKVCCNKMETNNRPQSVPEVQCVPVLLVTMVVLMLYLKTINQLRTLPVLTLAKVAA
jgi:hypothetical protein